MNQSDYHLACDIHTSAETLTQLAQQSTDIGILSQIASNPNAPGHLLSTLWHHPRVVAVREADPNPRDFAGYDASDEDALHHLESSIARHPNLVEVSQTLLAQLALDWNFGRLVLFAANAAPQILEVLVQCRLHDAELVHHRNTPGDALEIIACRVYLKKLNAIESHPNRSPLAEEIIAYRRGQPDVSQTALDLLAEYGDVRPIISHPLTSATRLHQIFNRYQPIPMHVSLTIEIFTLLTRHPNISTATLQAISDWLVQWYQGTQERKTVYRYLDAPLMTLFAALDYHAQNLPEIRVSLARLDSVQRLFQMSLEEKLALAADTSSADETLSLLVQDVSEGVLCAVAKNPITSLKLLEVLLAYRSQAIEDTLAENPNTHVESLRELYRRQQSRAFKEQRLWLIAAHPNTPQDILTILARYQNPHIRAALERNPNFHYD